MAGEEGDVLLIQIAGHAIGGGLQVFQPSLLGLAHPGLVIAVAVEDDALVLVNDASDQTMKSRLKIVGVFQLVGVLVQGLRHSGVQHHIRP